MRPDQVNLESIIRRRSIRDAAAVAVLCVLTYMASSQFEIFDRLYAFIKNYDSYDLDELIVVAFVFGFLMVAYTVRRGQDFKLEIAKREEFERLINSQASQLATAVNNIPQGIVMYDAAERLVVCNEFYLKMYELPADIVKPGITLRELFEQRIKTGHLVGSSEYYRSKLLALIAKKMVSHRVVETADGREIAITDYPLGDGSWVAIHEDRRSKAA
jgi:PAS domain-containing protein